MKKGFDYPRIVAVPMLHNGSGKYLISQRGDACPDENGRWEPAGAGGIDHGETMQEAVVREIMEECGAEVSDIDYLGFREVFRDFDGEIYHHIAFDFKVKAVNPEGVKITEPDKCSEIRWCTIDEIPTPMHSQFPIFLEKYKDKL